MFETAILVLLYNKEIAECSTLKSLLESKIQYSNAKLVIWNNGPEALIYYDSVLFEEIGYDVSLGETLSNESIAIIYNRFLAENKANKYIFLDDDSVLNTSYILASSKSMVSEISMPIISAAGKIRSPEIDGKAYELGSQIGEINKVITVGSGLVVGSGITSKLEKYYGNVFDERFYIYGVDTTFCIRIHDMKLNNTINVIAGFDHSLSRLEKEDRGKSDFRRLERSCSIGLVQKYYYPLSHAIFVLLRVSVLVLISRLFNEQPKLALIPLVKAYLSGKHYRLDRE